MSDNNEGPFEKTKQNESSGSGAINFVMYVGVFVLFLGIGYAVNTFLFSKSASPQSDENESKTEEVQKQKEDKPSPKKDEELVFIDFDPINTNLNDDRMKRYVSCTLKLAIDTKDKEEAEALITKKKVILKNGLNIYMSGLKLNDVSGRANRNRIRREIQDIINHELWPNQQPIIRDVLLDEFVIQ